MKLIVNIKTDNAAFTDGQNEVDRLLREVVDQIGEGETERNLYDINGNRVGNYKVTGSLTYSEE